MGPWHRPEPARIPAPGRTTGGAERGAECAGAGRSESRAEAVQARCSVPLREWNRTVDPPCRVASPSQFLPPEP